MFGNSWDISYITCLLLITIFLFTCDEKKICLSIKMSQNIMKIMVAQVNYAILDRFKKSTQISFANLNLFKRFQISWYLVYMKTSCNKHVVKKYFLNHRRCSYKAIHVFFIRRVRNVRNKLYSYDAFITIITFIQYMKQVKNYKHAKMDYLNLE